MYHTTTIFSIEYRLEGVPNKLGNRLLLSP